MREIHDARFAATLEDAWRTARSVSVGRATSDADGNLVVGHGASIHLISLETFSVTSHALDAYFGHLYLLHDALLATDSRFLWRVNADGSIAWRSPPLGIDGVVVFEIEDGAVHGEAEHDPPGGWRAFRVSFATGELLD